MALAVAFLVLALVAHVALAVVARNTAESAAAATARRVARPEADLGREQASLLGILETTLPGATDTSIGVHRTVDRASVEVRFRWSPPGPVFVPVELGVTASAAPSERP